MRWTRLLGWPLDLVLVVVLVVAVVLLSCAAEDDGVKPKDCGETSAHCEGQ